MLNGEASSTSERSRLGVRFPPIADVPPVRSHAAGLPSASRMEGHARFRPMGDIAKVCFLDRTQHLALPQPSLAVWLGFGCATRCSLSSGASDSPSIRRERVRPVS